jgi:hypothetical protein
MEYIYSIFRVCLAHAFSLVSRSTPDSGAEMAVDFEPTVLRYTPVSHILGRFVIK